MAEHTSYDELTRDFDWSIAEKELGYNQGDNNKHRMVLFRQDLQ